MSYQDRIGNTIDCGSIFKLSPPVGNETTWHFAKLYDFQGNGDGCHPISTLTVNARGVVYGVTTGDPSNAAAIFRLVPRSESPAYAFQALVTVDPRQMQPNGPLLIGPGGRLFGSAYGTPRGGGAVYELVPPSGSVTSWRISYIYTFSDTSQGYDPIGALVADSAGALYGVTLYGGIGDQRGNGTIFSLTPPTTAGGAWAGHLVHAFAGGLDGSTPQYGLTKDKRGALYAITLHDGKFNAGTAVQVVP